VLLDVADGLDEKRPAPSEIRLPSMATLVLTVTGADRAGLVSSLSTSVAEHGGSWLTSRMARLAGTFAGVVLVEVPDEQVSAFREGVVRLADSGLAVAVTVAGPASATSGIPLRLNLIGHDRPGIVHQVSAALAAFGASIDHLATQTREAPMAGGVLFEAEVDVTAPPSADLPALRSALEEIADELMVDIEVSDPGLAAG